MDKSKQRDGESNQRTYCLETWAVAGYLILDRICLSGSNTTLKVSTYLAVNDHLWG
jgi:hypothetical protein